MQAILDLQKMEAPTVAETALGSSCTSSNSSCCNGSSISDS
jgi:hypothetical protein